METTDNSPYLWYQQTFPKSENTPIASQAAGILSSHTLVSEFKLILFREHFDKMLESLTVCSPRAEILPGIYRASFSIPGPQAMLLSL